MKKILVLLCSIFIITGQVFGTDIQLFVNNQNITASSSPVIVNNRLLVPVKFVAEELDGEVTWHADERMVELKRNDVHVKLWIDSYIFSVNGQYDISDVAPTIINERTYVPVKLVSNLFGVNVKWEDSSRSVYVDGSISESYTPFFDFDITSHSDGGVIEGETIVSVNSSITDADTLKLLLLDKDTHRGYIVSSSNNLNAIRYIPKVEDKGDKLLVAAYYNSERQLMGADVIDIDIDVKPSVVITGIEEKTYDQTITIGQQVNFLPQYVNYEITEVATGEVKKVTKRDPIGTYSFKPTFENNGAYTVKVTAFDGNDVPYESQSITVNFDVDRYLNMGGISSGKTISKEVSLIASRNFDVTETIFMIKDVASGNEEVLATIPWGSYKWFPDMTYHGEKDIYVKVIDVSGKVYTSAPIRVTVDGTPKLYLHGVGPNQILTGSAKLSVSSNVAMENIKYYIKNDRLLGSDLSLSDTLTYQPVSGDHGTVSIYAQGTYAGQTVTTDTVTLTVYLKDLYGSKPIVEKSSFKSFASELALGSFRKTGMSASLQVAQAILETGWGQYVPVDKYTGKFSYNLFGIKGSATNGSVTSNTWEVYNGTSFRVDADFRAYNNVDESWQDHKRILLELSRYEPYREVMYDSTLGAYAVRRCGYATDPNYPMKLIDIIDKYDLKRLDEVGLDLK